MDEEEIDDGRMTSTRTGHVANGVKNAESTVSVQVEGGVTKLLTSNMVMMSRDTMTWVIVTLTKTTGHDTKMTGVRWAYQVVVYDRLWRRDYEI